MRLTVFLLAAFLFQVKASGTAQPVTISGKNMPLKQVFKTIERQTGYVLFSNRAILSNAKAVTISVQNMPLEVLLRQVLRHQPIDYFIKDKTIVLSQRIGGLPENRPATSDATRIQPEAEQPYATIKGVVTDAKTREPIVGASVVVKGSKQGTTTDKEGNFSIETEKGQVLVITSVGYVQQEVPVTASTTLSIQLEVSDASMKDVVVTGLFNRKAESFTGSTATFSQKDLLQVGNQNVLRSLANLDPSFRIMENLEIGSDPNRLPDIQMRGQTGLPDLNNEYGTNPNLPLFILDGFETTLQRIRDLDIYLVKSMTLLKDAASKAVYGSRAANGVVVIETLRPSAGKLQVTYNYNLNVELPDLSSYNLADARQKLDIEMMTDPYLLNTTDYNTTINNGWWWSDDIRHQYDQKLEEILRGVNTDWLEEPLRNGFGHRHSLTLGGGRDEIRYSVELGYNDIKGAMIGSQRKTYSGGIQLAYRKNAVSVSSLFRVTATRGDNSPYGTFQLFAEQNPYMRPKNEDGSFPFTSPLYNGSVGVQDFTTENTLVNNTEVIWNILPSLRLNGRLGYSRLMSGSDLFLPAAHNSFPRPNTSGNYDPNSVLRGSYSKTSGNQNRLNTTLTLNYNKVIGKSALYANLGADANSISSDNYAFKVVGFPNSNLSFPAAAVQYAPESRLNGAENLTRDMGVYAAVNYVFDDRFLADASWRTIRSSQFGVDNPSADFWSFGLGWNIHNEGFLKQSQVIDVLRLTANTGYTGSQPLNAYIGYPVYRYQMDNLYYGQYALGLTAVANPVIGAQRKQDNNFSLNTELLDKRLSLTVDYYVSNTDGLLVDINLPLSTGFYSFKANQGRVENRGIDLRVNYQAYRDLVKGNFISFYGTMGHNKNTLKELSNTLIALTTTQDKQLSSALKQRFEVGSSLNTIWAVPSRGIDPATGKEVFVRKDGTTTYEWNAADQVASGNNIATLYGNFGFSLRFSGWQLNTSFAYQWGGQKYNTTLLNKVENIDRTKNVDERVFTSRWQQPGDKTFFKGITELGATYPTTRFVEDWNELTLANANISYDLDRLVFIKNAGIRRLRASLVMDNAFVLSTMRIERGTAYPFARTFSFTLQTNF